jgi:hypothetical protein
MCSRVISSFRVFSQKFDDSKEVIGSRKSQNDKQYNGQNEKDKRTNNDLLNITQETKDRATRTPLKRGGEHRCSGGVSIPVPHKAPVALLLLQTRWYMNEERAELCLRQSEHTVAINERKTSAILLIYSNRVNTTMRNKTNNTWAFLQTIEGKRRTHDRF